MRLLCLTTFFSLLFFQSVFSQKPGIQTPPPQKVVTGIILLNEKKAPDAKTLLAHLKTTWKLRTDSTSATEKTIVFSTGTETVMVAYLDYPVNPAEIAAAARLSWIWRNAAAEASKHQAQVVISVIGSNAHTLDLYKTFTKVAAGVLEHTTASGAYMNSQYLLLPKEFYLTSARNLLKDKNLPVYCWVYMGIMEEATQCSGYTYGLRDFGLEEMEIVKATGSASEIHAVLFDAATSVIQYDTHLQDGQQFTTIEGSKLNVKKSKAAFIDGETFKLEF